MIILKNITKSYEIGKDRLEVLHSISLQVKKGEFVGIIGKSGSGKSTLVKCMGLMDSFDYGTYILDGEEVEYKNIKKANYIRKKYISFIFQHYELLSKFNVYENIEIPLLARNINLRERKKRIMEGAERLGISELMKKYPEQLSGGQQQRVGVLRAIVSDTPILLADEPTGALDIESSNWVITELKKINKSGKTVIVVSHDSDVIERCDRVIEIREGVIS